MQRIATHYDLLGVPADASIEAIRLAYRNAAREHHPDVARSGAAAVSGGVASERMAALNEAWRVLGDPARRARYDVELSRARGSAPAASPPPDVERGWQPTDAAAHYPWRFVLGLAAFGIAIVIVGVIVYHPSNTPPPPDNILGAQSCVVIEPNGDARETHCSQPHDGVVGQLVPFDAPCPDGTEAHRDRQGMGTACVRLVGAP